MNVTTNKKSENLNKLYTDFLGKHVRIVKIIVKSQGDKLFQVVKSDENNFHYDIQIRVRNDDKKQGDCFRRRWITWFHVRKSGIVNKEKEDRKLYRLYAAREFTTDEILGCYMRKYVEQGAAVNVTFFKSFRHWF